MKTMIPPVVALCLAITLFSCAAEDIEMQAEELNAANLEVYQTQDLEGIWEIESMHSDVAVDFNGDKTSNSDILKETGCFNNMFYDFKSDGTVTTDQAKLHFDSNGIMSCQQGVYSSPYLVKNDSLSVSFHDKNENIVKTRKKISLTDNKQKLHITLERWETSAYIKNDNGNSTEVINSITTVYKKQAAQ